MKKDWVVIQQGRDGLFYWHRQADNGRIISQGEGYTRRWSAFRGARRANPDVPVKRFEGRRGG